MPAIPAGEEGHGASLARELRSLEGSPASENHLEDQCSRSSQPSRDHLCLVWQQAFPKSGVIS